MSKQQQAAAAGWAIFAAALGVILVQFGNELAALPSWDLALTPAFIGKAFVHVGTVVGAFVGGKMIPTRRGV